MCAPSAKIASLSGSVIADSGDDMNPVSGLMVGILCTVCLQSSSTTTSIIVTLVGAGAISVSQGIYMVMGANIGTSVTNTIVAMGQYGDGDQLERAFAGATVHDMFNFLTVAILFPVEVITGMLDALTAAMVKNVSTEDGSSRDGFVKKYIAVVGELLIKPNKKANGESCYTRTQSMKHQGIHTSGSSHSVG